jgi:hypothetical protein
LREGPARKNLHFPNFYLAVLSDINDIQAKKTKNAFFLKSAEDAATRNSLDTGEETGPHLAAII